MVAERFLGAILDMIQLENTEQAAGLRQALLESCKVYDKRSGRVSKNYSLYGTYEQWRPICAALPGLTSNELVLDERDSATALAFRTQSGDQHHHSVLCSHFYCTNECHMKLIQQ